MTYAPPLLRPTLPMPAVRRAIEQSRDLVGYMVWPTEMEAQVNAAADDVTGLCWTSTAGPSPDPAKPRTQLSCLLPINHDGECGWVRPLTMRSGSAVRS